MKSIDTARMLRECFPNIRFISNSEYSDRLKDKSEITKSALDGLENMDIYNFIIENKIEDKETFAISIIESVQFSYLFPSDAKNYKEELRQSIKKEQSDIIKFYLKNINKKYVCRFYNICKETPTDNYKNAVDNLYSEVFDNKTFFPLELNDAKSLNICLHSPPTLYGAFEYYAHKHYTLLRLGYELPKEDLYNERNAILSDKNYNDYICEFYKSNLTKIHEDIFKKLKEMKDQISPLDIADTFINNFFLKDLNDKIVKANGYNITKDMAISLFYTNILKITESTPKGYDKYDPTDFKKLFEQVKGQIGNLIVWENRKKDADGGDQSVFTKSDCMTIKKNCKKLKDLLQSEKKDEFEIVCKKGTIFDKVKQFNEITSNNKNLKESFQERSIVFMDGMLKKLSKNHDTIDVEQSGDEITYRNELFDGKELLPEETLLSKENRNEFITNFLKPEFELIDEVDFINYFYTESWNLILAELVSYITPGRHNKNSKIFENYLNGRNPTSANHTIFANKVSKAFNAFLAWHRKNFNELKQTRDLIYKAPKAIQSLGGELYSNRNDNWRKNSD